MYTKQPEPPSVIMIASSVGDNHQSVNINCHKCDEIKTQMLAESLAIKTALLQIHTLLLDQRHLGNYHKLNSTFLKLEENGH